MASVAFLLCWIVACPGDAAAEGAGNLARGKPYTVSHPPNYRHSTDSGDRSQLTDGVLSRGYFWTQKETVGWSRVNPVLITIDLGARRPIGGVSFRTAFGTAGVLPPDAIYLLAGDDRKTLRLAGELVALSADEIGPPEEEGYRVHTYRTRRLAATGRYLAVTVVPRGPYTFCDEIEVYPGRPQDPTPPPEPTINDPIAWVQTQKVILGIRTRLEKDLEAIIAQARRVLPGGDAEGLEGRAEALRRRIRAERSDPGPGFRAIVPCNALHREILGLNAAALVSSGFRGLVPWHRNRYAPLLPHEFPPGKEEPELDVFLMRNEYRADILNLTNATEREIEAALSFRGLPGGPAPSWIRVHQVEFVDTASRTLVADALPPAPMRDGKWCVTIPAGMTRQVWFTFHLREVKAGDYRGSIVVSGQGEGTVPIRVRISPLRFPDKPHLSLCLWDYTDDPPAYDLTPDNREAAIRHMREHFVDSPWARRGVLPWPDGDAFGENHDLRAKLDFGGFRRWAERWPGARTYFVFLSVGSGAFAGVSCRDDAFAPRVAAWARAWRDHVAELGPDPRRIAVLIIDEPHERAQDEIILAWARAIKSGAPEFTIWEDPTYREPEKDGLREMFLACDALCPNLGIFGSGSEASRRFYLDLVEGGERKLWFYQCAGPSRLLDPYSYHRLQAWFSWKYGAVGSGFWAYADSGGSAWNVYAAPRTVYSPVYIDPEGIVDGKHFEAVREGIEDVEYLHLLKEKVSMAKDAEIAAKASAILDRAIREVVPQYVAEKTWWRVEKDYGAADRLRRDVLDMLEAFAR